MTFERISDYFKCIFGMILLVHIFGSLGFSLFGMEPLFHRWEYVAVWPFAAAFGWHLVHKTEPIKFVCCPTCGSRVNETRVNSISQP